MRPIERLSVRDAFHLYANEGRAPVTIGWVAITGARGPRPDEVREAVRRRLADVPRLRQRVVPLPFGLGLPIWVDDADFDIADHVGEVRLPSGATEDRLLALVEELFAMPLPPDRPLWDLRVVTGLEGGRVALVQRLHHALADGVSAGTLAATLLRPGDAADATWRPRLAPTRRALLADNLRWRAATLAHAAWELGHPVGSARRARELARQVRALTGQTRAAPVTSLNRPLGPRRRLAWMPLPLQAVRVAGRRHGGTVNDVLLTVVAGGLRALLEARGERVPGPLLASVPVSVRLPGEDGLGNRTSGLLVPLHTDVADPRQRLERIAAETRVLKAKHAAPAVVGLLDSPFLLAFLLRRTGSLLRTQRLITTYVTDLVGPRGELRAFGTPVEAILPVVPIMTNITIGVGALSYRDRLHVAVRVDPDWIPDLDAFLDGLRTTFTALQDAAPSARRRSA